VFSITAYNTDDEAISIANDPIYGLSGEVSRADTERTLGVAQHMCTGNVTINGKSFFGITSPFGAPSNAGPGRRNGNEGFKEYLEFKTAGLPG
jgi:aldehyde dehydrogenase (NAD+)